MILAYICVVLMSVWSIKILLVENEKEIEIIGDWVFAHWGNGNYCVAYWINEINRK